MYRELTYHNIKTSNSQFWDDEYYVVFNYVSLTNTVNYIVYD